MYRKLTFLSFAFLLILGLSRCGQNNGYTNKPSQENAKDIYPNNAEVNKSQIKESTKRESKLLEFESSIRFGLTESQRKQLFKDITAAEDKANEYRRLEEDKALELKYDRARLKKEYAKIGKQADKLMKKYREQVLKKYKISSEQEKIISEEGFNKNWPLD